VGVALDVDGAGWVLVVVVVVVMVVATELREADEEEDGMVALVHPELELAARDCRLEEEATRDCRLEVGIVGSDLRVEARGEKGLISSSSL
jgi:hypothetical protein